MTTSGVPNFPMQVAITMHAAIQDTHTVLFQSVPGEYLINGDANGSETLTFSPGSSDHI